MRKTRERRRKKKKKKTRRRRRRQRQSQLAEPGMRKGREEEGLKRGRVGNEGRIEGGDEAASLGRIGNLLIEGGNPRRGLLSGRRSEIGQQRQKLGEREGARREEIERDVESWEESLRHRLVRQGGKENRNLSNKGERRRGKRRRSQVPKRKRRRRRGKKSGRERRLLPRSRLKSLKLVGRRGGEEKGVELAEDGVDEEEDDIAPEEEAGERKLKRRMKKLRKSRQLYLEQEQYRWMIARLLLFITRLKSAEASLSVKTDNGDLLMILHLFTSQSNLSSSSS